MKNKLTFSFSLLAISTVGLIMSGCQQTPESKVTGKLTETSSVASASDACCERCETEQVAAAQAEDCGETCRGEEETGAAKKAACCGKCEGEAMAIAKKKMAADGNECAVCAEGDPSKCKCVNERSKAHGAVQGSKSHAAQRVNTMPEDRDIFHFLLKNHDKISREVNELDNGVQTVTESTDPAIATKIQEHVVSMYKRVEDGRPLRMWDELYREIFKHADKIKMEIKHTKNGISVTETSDDEYVVKLIQAHAKVVSGFAERGFEEAHENHEPPKR